VGVVLQRKLGLGGGDDDEGGLKLRPTFGVSFGLPGGGAYPINPFSSYPAINPYGGSVGGGGGVNLGLVSVNPLLSVQVTKDDYGEKVVKPLVNLHVTPNHGFVNKIGSFIHKFKGGFGGGGYYGGGYGGGGYYPPGPHLYHHHYHAPPPPPPPIYKPHHYFHSKPSFSHFKPSPPYAPSYDYPPPHHHYPDYHDEYLDDGDYYRTARSNISAKASPSSPSSPSSGSVSFPQDRRSKRDTQKVILKSNPKLRPNST
jgi:hypothetical protein